jgi:hypothetical protein
MNLIQRLLFNLYIIIKFFQEFFEFLRLQFLTNFLKFLQNIKLFDKDGQLFKMNWNLFLLLNLQYKFINNIA